jgi:hypothetical protein
MSGHLDSKRAELLGFLDELDQLYLMARTKGIQPEDFVSGLRDAMQAVLMILIGTTDHNFLDANHNLSKAIVAFETDHTGMGIIGNALVRYRSAAVMAHNE